MTDKEIIIDGIDVSKCTHIDNWKHCNCCNDLIKTIYPKATKYHIEEDLRCEIYPNCYFKQLKHYKQALDEIEKYLDAQQKYFDGEDYHNLLDIINKAKEGN